MDMKMMVTFAALIIVGYVIGVKFPSIGQKVGLG